MKLKNYLLMGIALLLCSCEDSKKDFSDPLPSWNETIIKQQLIHYLNEQVKQIPVEDRVAVFDMDGTIACERPLWYEMAVSVHRMY